MTSKINTGKFSYQYGYDQRNRLASANITRKEGLQDVTITSSYTYNTAGIRTRAEQTINGITQNRYFLLDSGHTGYSQVFEETSSLGGNLVRSYVLGDDVLSQNVGGVTSHLLYDGHGSTRQLAGDDGAVTANYAYDAYGKMLGGNPGVTDGKQSATDLLYAGEQFDPGLQMEYLRARYYDQDNGRFNRLDPFEGNSEDPQSLHKYAYTHCDPVNGIDPSGNIKIPTSMLKLARKVGYLAAVLILVGIAAHKRIGKDYKDKHPHDWVFCNSPFFAIFGQSIIPVAGSSRRPDILNYSKGDIYEIKSYFSSTISQAAEVAGVQLNEYLNIIGDIAEHIPMLKELSSSIKPGTWQPESVYYLDSTDFGYILPTTIFVSLPKPGRIVYTPGPEVYFYAVAIHLAMKIPQIGAYNQARLSYHTNTGYLLTLFGFF